MPNIIRLLFLLVPLFVASVSTAAPTGLVLWADASNESTDTGNEVCSLGTEPPQVGDWALKVSLSELTCTSVFVPGSATEIACDADMTGNGTASDYYIVLCN